MLTPRQLRTIFGIESFVGSPNSLEVLEEIARANQVQLEKDGVLLTAEDAYPQNLMRCGCGNLYSVKIDENLTYGCCLPCDVYSSLNANQANPVKAPKAYKEKKPLFLREGDDRPDFEEHDIPRTQQLE
jgi:hypothetical protein